MAARHRNTRRRAVVALLVAALLAGGVQACGPKQSAQSIVDETFNAHRQINSGELDLSFSLSAHGLQGLAAPVSLRLSGPFQSEGSTAMPRFDLNLDLSSGERQLQAGAVSTAGAFFLELGGVAFLTPPQTRSALQQSYAQAGRAASSRQSVAAFSSLGIDPGMWLKHPAQVGTSELAGTRVIHIVAALDLGRFLADAARLQGASSTLGLSSGQAAGLLSGRETRALVRSLRRARVDLYTGSEDHLLRSLSVDASVLGAPAERTVLHGLRSATLRLAVSFTRVNQKQTILAPANPQPISRLLSALRQLGLAPAASEVSPPPSGAATAPAEGYQACARRAGQNVAALQRCTSLL